VGAGRSRGSAGGAPCQPPMPAEGCHMAAGATATGGDMAGAGEGAAAAVSCCMLGGTQAPGVLTPLQTDSSRGAGGRGGNPKLPGGGQPPGGGGQKEPPGGGGGGTPSGPPPSGPGSSPPDGPPSSPPGTPPRSPPPGGPVASPASSPPAPLPPSGDPLRLRLSRLSRLSRQLRLRLRSLPRLPPSRCVSLGSYPASLSQTERRPGLRQSAQTIFLEWLSPDKS